MKKRFLWWWENVFLYHYVKFVIAGLILLVVVVYLSIDAFTRVKYDFSIAIATERTLTSEEIVPLRSLVEEVVGDINGDGAVNVNIWAITLNDAHTEGFNSIEIALADEEYLLFLLNDTQSAIRGNRGDFDNLELLGFPVAEGVNYRVEVEGLADATFGSLATWKASGKYADVRTNAAKTLLKELMK